MLLLLLILIYIIILLLEVPTLWRHGWHRELFVFTGVFLLGVYLSLAQFFNWTLINPFESFIMVADRFFSTRF